MASALAVQGRVIHALILREIKTRFGRLQLGYIWALLEPILFVAIFYIMFMYGGRMQPSGMPLTLFLVTGIAPFLFFRNAMQMTMNAIDANRQLLTFPQVTPFDLVAARTLLEFMTMLVVFVILVSISTVIGEPLQIENPLAVLGILVLSTMFGFGLGTTFGALMVMFPSIQQIVGSLIIRPLFFTSGIFFSVEMLPGELRELLLINPILHYSEFLRDAYFAGFNTEYADLWFATTMAVSAVFFGLLIQRAMNRRILTPS